MGWYSLEVRPDPFPSLLKVRLLSSENAALPHGSGTDRKLCKTDLILIDAGGKWGGYAADITRVRLPLRSPDDSL
jgi:Xaa-Pro aminopeptidase